MASGVQRGISSTDGITVISQRMTPDGRSLVELDDAGGADLPALLGRLIWEVQELRRVYCEAEDQLFLEYPG